MVKRGSKGASQKSVDEIEEKLDNASHGLAALKTLINDVEGKLDNATHGLAALKTLIDAVEDKLDDPSHGLANLKTLIDALEAKLDHASHGLAALKTLIDTIEAKLDAWPAERGTDNAELEVDAAIRYVSLAAYVDEIESLLKNASYGLSNLKTLIDAIETKLDSPDNFKADVSALALEATLNMHDIDIKLLIAALNDISAADVWAYASRTLTPHAFPFTNPAAMVALTNLRVGLLGGVESYLDTSILSRLSKADFDTLIGALADESDLMGSVLSRSRAVFDSVHIHLGMVVADKTSLTATETAIVAALRKKYEVYIIDDDDVDAGNFDLAICEFLIVSTSVTDMTKINELTTTVVPIFTRNAEVALTILRMGDDGGGSGVSWGENAAETAINIVDNTHEITTDHPLGSLTVYSPAGRMQWIRATDVVAGAFELAEIAGDNTKSTIVVLPYDVDDEDGIPTPALRVFIGLREFANFNSNAKNLMFNAIDWAIHQWLFSVEVQGLGKINTVINMLGRKDFTTAKNLYDYLVTGTTDVIAEQESRSVMERLEWIKNGIRRGTGTILPANKSLYDILWVDKNTDEPGSFNWDTSAYTTNEQDISALFTTDLTGTKRREYQVYLDLSNVEGDGNFDECYIRVYVKINGTYQCIDKATKTKANLQAEPGVPIEIPKTAEDAKVTLQMKTALAGDQTINYSYVQEKLEY